jgi:hypothetical protein
VPAGRAGRSGLLRGGGLAYLLYPLLEGGGLAAEALRGLLGLRVGAGAGRRRLLGLRVGAGAGRRRLLGLLGLWRRPLRLLSLRALLLRALGGLCGLLRGVTLRPGPVPLLLRNAALLRAPGRSGARCLRGGGGPDGGGAAYCRGSSGGAACC